MHCKSTPFYTFKSCQYYYYILTIFLNLINFKVFSSFWLVTSQTYIISVLANQIKIVWLQQILVSIKLHRNQTIRACNSVIFKTMLNIRPGSEVGFGSEVFEIRFKNYVKKSNAKRQPYLMVNCTH